MAGDFEIRVYGKRRAHVDPRQLAHLLIELAPHLDAQRRAAEAAGQRGEDEQAPDSTGPDSR